MDATIYRHPRYEGRAVILGTLTGADGETLADLRWISWGGSECEGRRPAYLLLAEMERVDANQPV